MKKWAIKNLPHSAKLRHPCRKSYHSYEPHQGEELQIEDFDLTDEEQIKAPVYDTPPLPDNIRRVIHIGPSKKNSIFLCSSSRAYDASQAQARLPRHRVRSRRRHRAA